MKLCIQNKYLYPLQKNLIPLKNISLCKKFVLFKQTHSVKDEFNFSLVLQQMDRSK